MFDHFDAARWERCCNLFGMDPESDNFRSRPKWLRRVPFHYQAYGAYFLLENEYAGRANFLADEMGLGKVSSPKDAKYAMEADYPV